MYFDTTLKEKTSDFYNHKEELEKLENAIANHERLIIIRGLRRTGKSSLMRVVYNRMKQPKMWFDARKIFTGFTPPQIIYDLFYDLLKSFKAEEKIMEKIESISLVFARLKTKLKPELYEIPETVNNELKKRNLFAVLFIDEAQLLKKYALDNFFAYAYDSLSNIQVVMAGSEVGLLDDFIGSEADAPLFGRAKEIIEMKRLSREQALEFLKLGFSQAGTSVKEDEKNEAVDILDGLIGWITYYGHYRIKYSHEASLARVKEDAEKIIKQEFARFLIKRKKAERNYILVFKSLIEGEKSWEEIKTFMELRLKKRVNDSRLYEYLNALIDYSFILKDGNKYSVGDPLIKTIV